MPGPGAYPKLSPSPLVRRWSVTHTCDVAADLALLADAQVELGMRPALLTPAGWSSSAEPAVPAPSLSLVHAWREVRHWRALFDRECIGFSGEILHAHSFSAGMAAVRAGLPVVYDFVSPVGARGNAGPWLTRSLRIAEGFVLTRVSAVVVHSRRMWDLATAQGVRPEDLFLIPDPVALPSPIASRGITRCETGDHAVLFFASSDIDPDLLLRAFALLAEEIDEAHLLIDNSAAAAITQRAAELGLVDRVHVISSAERVDALVSADVVIAGPAAESPNTLAITALARSRALLAADVGANREVSAHGRGCLWYAANNERDLAFRAAFLARNPDFRSALGASGRAHLQATRGALAVARQYDEVYRHALSRDEDGRPHGSVRIPAFALCC